MLLLLRRAGLDALAVCAVGVALGVCEDGVQVI
jgi:hypothetical protein